MPDTLFEDERLCLTDAEKRTLCDLGLEVRGLLRVTDEIEMHGIVPVATLHAALRLLYDDDLVFLPPEEVLRHIRRLARLL